MFEDPRRFPFVQELKELFPIVRDEVTRLPESAWIRWPAANAIGVRTFPLLMCYRPPWIDEQWHERRALLPRTWKWIERQPRMYTAVISSMAPGGRILPHRDMEEPASLRAHLALSLPDPGTCTFQVEGRTVEWTVGDCLVFHPCREHEAANDGERARVVLIVDVRPEPAASGSR